VSGMILRENKQKGDGFIFQLPFGGEMGLLKRKTNPSPFPPALVSFNSLAHLFGFQ